MTIIIMVIIIIIIIIIMIIIKRGLIRRRCSALRTLPHAAALLSLQLVVRFQSLTIPMIRDAFANDLPPFFLHGMRSKTKARRY